MIRAYVGTQRIPRKRHGDGSTRTSASRIRHDGAGAPAVAEVIEEDFARPGKIFLDYLRNGRGASAIVPYSTRARPGAPVSVPLTWDALSPHIRSDHYTVRNLPKRLASLRRD